MIVYLTRTRYTRLIADAGFGVAGAVAIATLDDAICPT